MTTHGYAFPPPAFFEFCEREPRLCASQGEKKVARMTPERRHQLEEVNRRVNDRVTQINDRGGRGADLWEAAGTTGDCEDIAIRKKAELMEKGWPASTLLLTVVRPRIGNDGHTVLTVRTSDGDYILDNLHSRLLLWSRTPYRFFARQSQDEHGQWERIRS